MEQVYSSFSIINSANNKGFQRKSLNPFDDDGDDDDGLLPASYQHEFIQETTNTRWKTPLLVRVSSWMPVVIAAKTKYYVYIVHVVPHQMERKSYIIEKRYSSFRTLYLVLLEDIDKAFPEGMKNPFPNVSYFSFATCCPCLERDKEAILNQRVEALNLWMRELCLEPKFMNNQEAFVIFNTFLQSDKVRP